MSKKLLLQTDTRSTLKKMHDLDFMALQKTCTLTGTKTSLRNVAQKTVIILPN